MQWLQSSISQECINVVTQPKLPRFQKLEEKATKITSCFWRKKSWHINVKASKYFYKLLGCRQIVNLSLIFRTNKKVFFFYIFSNFFVGWLARNCMKEMFGCYRNEWHFLWDLHCWPKVWRVIFGVFVSVEIVNYFCNNSKLFLYK